MSGGGRHVCGLRQDGSASCWGDDDYGQTTPPKGERFIAISVGHSHTCELREDGVVLCWGRFQDGEPAPPER